MGAGGFGDEWVEIRDGTGLWGVSGVFCVAHLPSGRLLVVATTDIGKRVHDQRRYLRTRRHCNPEVCRDVNEDGPDAFRIFLIQRCHVSHWLPVLKQDAIDRAGSRAYNRRPAVSKRHPRTTNVSSPPERHTSA